jgi:hypothetical protein
MLPDEAPSSGALATGADGALLLILHSKSAQKAAAVQLPTNLAGEQTAKVWLPQEAMQPVLSCMKPCSGPGHAHVPGAVRSCQVMRCEPNMTMGLAMQVVFTLSAAAVTTLQATRANPDAQPPARDILVLHPRGRLSLYVGAHQICHVSVRAPGPPSAQTMRPVPSTTIGQIRSDRTT